MTASSSSEAKMNIIPLKSDYALLIDTVNARPDYALVEIHVIGDEALFWLDLIIKNAYIL